MRSIRSLAFAVAAATVLLIPPAAGAQELSNDAQRVVDYLLEDWQRRFSSSTIPHALEWLGMEPDDALRLEIVAHLRADDSLARNLQYWGANNYLFSNLEKRIAKYLILRADRGEQASTAAEAAAELKISEAALRERLAFMADGGFLAAAAGSDLGFELAPGFRRWAGPLQHNYHTVFIDGEAPLDVW